MIDPDPSFQPPVGIDEPLAPGLRRVLAPNPSPMTFRGTNTYLLGESALAVIDPGPDDPNHLEAILASLRPGQTISHILVSHAHIDHSPLARPLAEATGAPVLAFGDAAAGRSPVMQTLAAQGLVGGGEGVDAAFVPDEVLRDGDEISGPGWHLTALHLPGHMGNHVCFAWGETLFSADLVMGWASSLVSPPDGDLTDFMASLRRLQAHRWSVFHAGHGAPVTDPRARLVALIAHRKGREAAILDALAQSPAAPATLAERIYTDTPTALMPAATRNVLAHLVDLAGKSLVTPQGDLSTETVFART